MILKKWKYIPNELKNTNTKKYYDILSKKKFSLIVKRLFDLIVSAVLLILLSPIMLIIAIAIKLDSKGPVFYRQERVTTNNKTFKIFKFRTMVQKADKTGSLITLGRDPRITRVGNLIRKCRLDELPQVINILIGDMSFVGTRPEVRKYVECYTDEMKATLFMKAGVTSIASIRYRNEDDVMNKYINLGESVDDVYVNRVLPDKMKYNLEYIEKFNVLYDIKILLDTVLAVLRIKKVEEVEEPVEQEKKEA